jgi:hypothetical protein
MARKATLMRASVAWPALRKRNSKLGTSFLESCVQNHPVMDGYDPLSGDMAMWSHPLLEPQVERRLIKTAVQRGRSERRGEEVQTKLRLNRSLRSTASG